MSLAVGSIVEGRVTGITNFGAFVDLGSGQTGLVHISEVADTYVKDVKDFVKENETIKVKVIAMDNGKIGLSIRQVTGEATRPKPPERRPSGGFRGDRRPSSATFEDKLARFMRESDEKMSDLKRSQDSKRGGRGTKFGRAE